MGTSKELSSINFFICSTYIDLVDYREKIIDQLKSESGVINAQEFFGARNQKPIETCLEEVEKSDVFIMIFGWRFGSKDPESDKYFIQLEYEKAKKLKLPIFVFFMDEEFPFPPKFIATGDEGDNLIQFKDEILKKYTREIFTTPDDLSRKVLAALKNELPKNGFTIGKRKNEFENLNTITTLEKFMAIPKLYENTEITFTGRVGAFKRANVYECDAMNFPKSATVKRSLLVNSEIYRDSFNNFDYIYASNRKAEELINLSSEEEYEFTALTKFGHYLTQQPIKELRTVHIPENRPLRMSAISDNLREINKEVIIRHESKEEIIFGLEFIGINNKS